MQEKWKDNFVLWPQTGYLYGGPTNEKSFNCTDYEIHITERHQIEKRKKLFGKL